MSKIQRKETYEDLPHKSRTTTRVRLHALAHNTFLIDKTAILAPQGDNKSKLYKGETGVRGGCTHVMHSRSLSTIDRGGGGGG